MALVQRFSELICIQIILIGAFEISHFEIKFAQKEVIIINLLTVFEDILGDLNGCFYSLDGEIILAEFFKTNGAIYNCVNESTIVDIFLSNLYALIILFFCLVEKLVFIQVIGVLE